ncbi:MAG: hypothetical protein PHN44_00045 [Candidatus Marinimicrobia bacterium]|nr:hypothetical protein [Candidatus Neomarinimicrobiota bacterium]
MESDFLRLNLRDLFRGLIVAAGTGIGMGTIDTIPVLNKILESGVFPTKAQWIMIAAFSVKSSITAFGTYLVMNVFSGKKAGTK